MATRTPRRRLAAWGPVVALVAAMLVLGVVAWLDGWHLGADSAVYRAGGWAFLRGEPLYDRTALTALPPWVLLPFTYAPAAALLFAPLAAVPSGLTWGLLGVLSIASLAVVVRIFAGRFERWWTLGLAIAAALALEPVWKTVFLGQINLVLMALVVVDVLVLCARGSRWGGVLVGVAAAIKLVPLIFVPHLLLTRQWRDALRALGTFAGLQAAMFGLSPADAVEYWTEAATDPGRVGAVHWIFNQSLNGLVHRASTLAPWSLEVAMAFGALLAVPAAWLVLRLRGRGDAPGALLVSAFYGLVVSPVSWSHHWVWAVPLIVLLAVRGRRLAALAVATLFASHVVMLVPNGGDEEFRWGLGFSLLGNAYVLAAVAGIAGLAGWELLRSRARTAVPAEEARADAL